MFLGNLLSGIRNFVGGLTGGNRDEEERRRRQQQQPQRPQATVVRPLSLQEARSQAPGQLPQPTAQLTGGVKAPTLSKQDKELISKYNNPVNDKAFDRSRQVFNKILESPQNKDYEQAKRIAPYITQNKTQARLNRTLTETAKFAGDIAKTPVDVVQSAVKAPVMILNQLTGGKTELSPFAAKLLGEEDRRIGNLAEYGRQTRTGVSGALGRVSAQESGWDPLIGLGLSLLDLSPAAGVGLGLRTGIKEGTKSGLAQGIKSGTYRATGARNTLTQSDIGGVPEAQVAAGVRRLGGLERVTQEMPAPRDPTSPITVSPPSQKRPAITSGNPDFVPPELREVPPLQPAPIQVTRPEIGGTQAVTDLTEQLRRAEQTAPQQADEVAQAELARVQQAIDEQTVQPRPEPAPVTEAQVELPTTAQAREVAQATPPVAPEIIEQAVKAEAARQAPTEVPPAPEGAVAPVSTGLPQQKQAEQTEQNLIDEATAKEYGVKDDESYARAISLKNGYKPLEIGNKMILFKGTGGDMQLGYKSDNMRYWEKLADSKKYMPENTTSFADNYSKASEYGKVNAYTMNKNDILTEDEYKNILMKSMLKDGMADSQKSLQESMQVLPSGYKGYWRRADKLPSLIPDIKKAGYKAFTDINGEIIVLDKSAVKKLKYEPKLEEVNKLREEGYDVISFPETGFATLEGRPESALQSTTYAVLNPEVVKGAPAPQLEAQPAALQIKASATQTPEQVAIAAADKQTTDIIKQANATLASEKKSYGDLVVKLARNNEPGAVPKTLTPAENKIYSEIKPQLDAIVLKMNKLGLTDEDMGWLRQYLPTAKADELGAINSIEDVARREFGFTLRRENKLSDEQVKQGAEQALRDYLRTGQLLDYLDTDVVDSVKVERLSNDINNMIEQGYQDKPTGMKLTDDEITEMRQENANFVEKQRALVNAQRVVDEGDMSDEAISARNAAEKEAEDTLINKRVNDYLRLERKTDEKIAEINNSNLSPVQKIKAKNDLEAHLAVVRNQTYYLQSATRTNMLLGVGRIADQINKATQATADTLTGAISKTGAGRQFKKDVGRDLFADGSTAGAVWNKIKNTPGLNQSRFNLEVNRRIVQQQTVQKGALAKLGGKYRVFGTRLTEAGSRYQRPAKDATSYFVAKGKAEGITDINDLARYVEDAVGTSEWNRVYGQMYDIRNRFTGVPTFTRDVNGMLISGNRNIKLNIRQGIYSALGNVPGLSRNVRDNIADAITIPVFGFPALVARLGVRGFEHATGGVTDFIRAANIKPVNEAQALERALLVKRGLDSAQTGPALYALGIGLGAAGLTTGAYPEDKAEQKRWESEQIQPYSIKIGDVYVDPSRYIGPLAFPLMLGTSLGSGRFTEEAPQAIGNIIKQISQNYGADNIADIMETAAKLMKGDVEGAWQNGLSNWTSGIINAFVPGASLLNTAGKLTDEVRRETGTTLTDKLAGKFPGTRQTLPVKTDAFGNPIQQGGLMNLFPAVTGGQGATRTPVTEELNRLAQTGVEAYPGTTAGTGKNVKLKNQLDEDIKLTSQQQASLNAAVKKEKENQALLVMSSETYQSATDEEKGNLLKKVYGLDSAAVASQWAQDNGIKGVKQTSEKVNNNLPVESQQALLEYRLQGDKGKVWLDDFNNAARYYNAAYENAKLNGTLTRKDDSLQNKNGLRYKAVVAKIDAESGVTPDIKDLYSTVTVSEWRKLADPENDAYDPDLAARLFAYDELRTKAGVSLGKYTDKPKYSQKAGGGRGGRGSDRFAFATLPSSLMGTTAAVGAGYDKGERLFKPIPDLQAPPTVVIPKGRSISVKRGVQL